MITLGLIALLMTLAQTIAAPTHDSPWCGLGALRRAGPKQAAPMVYRVLALPFRRSAWCYLIFKFATTWGALVCIMYAWGERSALITAVILPLTFWYDYWDWPIELAGVAMAASGNLPAAVLLAVAWGMSRETAPLSGMIYFLATWDALGGLVLVGVAFLTMTAVRAWVGRRGLYCDRWMVRVNIGLLQKGNIRAWASVILCGLIIAAAVVSLRPDTLVPLVIIAAGASMGKLDETRLFSAAIPYLARML